jgi:hypothetical protein
MKQVLGLTILLVDHSDFLCTGDRFLKTLVRITISLLKLQTWRRWYPTGTQTGFVVPVKRYIRAILKRNCNAYTLIFCQVHYQYGSSWREECLPLPPERPKDFMEALRRLHCTRRQIAKYAVTFWSVRLWLMLQNCGAGRNACAERRSLAALQRHSEGNVSGVLITFAIHSLRRPTIHTQFSGFLKNEIFTLRIQTYTRTLQFIERTIDLCEYDRQDFVVAKSLLWFGASLVRDARKY